MSGSIRNEERIQEKMNAKKKKNQKLKTHQQQNFLFDS
jgi:hypothetical protein